MSLRVFEKERPLSQKPHATIYRGDFRTEIVAVKRFKSGIIAEFEREVRKLQKLEHRNIVEFLAVFRNRDGTIDLVMRMGELENLGDAIRNQSHTFEWKYSMLYQISSGLAYLHDNDIIHGNLTPNNIIFRDLAHGRAMIGNYCKAARLQSPPKAIEDMIFEAPEGETSKPSDVYSLTLVVCCILVHTCPEPL
ncbi:serine/threonine-protein kinase STY8-like [Galendromus occidentalis]|uniref:Serine/threonine-protein kinase STY8-like n=1 Tax=Galendromus occidentalis TaxID=34638 RepID=A0AAJ6W133_9ACAR|nr:serine/threonine-protein kinase STY8-like [Galendromus occidentalis]